MECEVYTEYHQIIKKFIEHWEKNSDSVQKYALDKIKRKLDKYTIKSIIE